MFFNNNYLSQNQKFYRSLILMVPIAIVFSLLYIFLVEKVPYVSYYLYLILGYGIGYTTSVLARSYQRRFGFISIATAILMLFLGDIFWPWLFSGLNINLFDYIMSFVENFIPLSYDKFIDLICYTLTIVISYFATFKAN